MDLYFHHPRAATIGLNDNYWPTKVAVARVDMEEIADIELEIMMVTDCPTNNAHANKFMSELRCRNFCY